MSCRVGCSLQYKLHSRYYNTIQTARNMSKTAYKLVYFPLMGRAECIRYIFAAANQAYDEETISPQKWPKRKPDFPFKTLPVLQINHDGKTDTIAQHLAICRYLAKELGLVGAGNIEKAKADMLVDACNELWAGLGPIDQAIFTQKHEEKEKLSKKFVASSFKPLMDIFTAYVNTNGFIVGEKLTWADLYIAEFVHRITLIVDGHALDEHPQMQNFVNTINSIPQIKKRLQERPKMII